MNISAQLFKDVACKRLAKSLPSAVPVMGKVDIDKVVKVVKTTSKEVYIVSQDTQGKYENSYHVWFMHRSGFILRSGNGVLGYKSLIKANYDLDKTMRLKGQRAVKAS
ncbi:hypothetical protein V6C59_17490 [Acinetobacter bereziniae]|uniref:hypothetical protein n=1 Tax=Acinetobacter bereziniae TaxID=106648 RepID=UPI002FDA7A81